MPRKLAAEAVLSTTRTGDVVAARLTGELDLATAPEAVAGLEAVIAERPRRLVLDLRELSFTDSVGLAALIRVRRRAAWTGVELVLDVGDGTVAQLLRQTKLDSVFDFV